ncbi:MAG: hemerythrin domain-containing protein [Chryseobacterium sp.]|nr:hemerythrin domain-containing protein [Chryseobacterium sp.]
MNKPIKRNENLMPVSREHHATLLFCWKLKQGVKKEVSADRMKNYIHWFWKNHMLPHFKTEEELLFVETSDPMVARALNEHQRILSKINEISVRNEENVNEAILQLSDLVNQHTRYEERELFPYLEEHLTDENLTEIGRQLHGEEHNAEENYHDEFWAKENTP